MVKIITDQNFEDSIKEGYVFVDFFAEWCGPCKMLAPVMEELNTEFEGKLEIMKLDIDANRETATKFGIQSIPTMILFKDGKPVEKVSGFHPKPKLAQYLESKVNEK